jgi:hypothetical protein
MITHELLVLYDEMNKRTMRFLDRLIMALFVLSVIDAAMLGYIIAAITH